MDVSPPTTAAEGIARVTPLLRRLPGRVAFRCGVEADDAFQMLALDLVQNWRLYNPARGALTTLVFMRYQRLCWLLLRKKRLPISDDTEVVGNVMTLAGREPDPATEAEHRDELGLLAAALPAIPERQRRAVRMRYGLDPGPETLPELATAIGLTSRAGARCAVTRGLERLSVLMGGDPAAVCPSEYAAAMRRRRGDR